MFYGCFGFADDLLLLSASRTGLQSMVDICCKFMKNKGLKFSTSNIPAKSKTKCIVFTQKKIANILPIKLDGTDLPWVNQVKHLGNILENNNSMSKDINSKRGQFIGKVNALSQEFHFAEPSVFMKILNLYAISFSGSSLWDLFSKDCQRIYNAWNVTVRQAFKVPRNTHRYLIEPVSQSPHLKTLLCSRYCRFVDSILNSPKLQVRMIGRQCVADLRTKMGNNILNISKECGLVWNGEVLPTSTVVKKSMKFVSVPECEKWREGVLSELLSGELQVDGFEEDEILEMIECLCST